MTKTDEIEQIYNLKKTIDIKINGKIMRIKMENFFLMSLLNLKLKKRNINRFYKF